MTQTCPCPVCGQQYTPEKRYRLPNLSVKALRLRASSILNTVAEYFEIEEEELKGRSRASRLADPRHIAMYLIYRHSGLGLKATGQIFNRDHTTVIHAKKRVEMVLQTRMGFYHHLMCLQDMVLNDLPPLPKPEVKDKPKPVVQMEKPLERPKAEYSGGYLSTLQKYA